MKFFIVKRIIIDTNFLLMPYQFKVDIFSEINRLMMESYKLCIINTTITELKKIIETQKGKHRRAAMLGLMILSQKNIAKIKAKKPKVDDSILAEAGKNKDCIVATQDAELKKRLRKKGVPLIVLKSKSHLALIGA